MKMLRLPWRRPVEKPARDWRDDPDDPTIRILEEYSAGPLSPDRAALDRMGAVARQAFLEAQPGRGASGVPARGWSARRVRLAAAFSVAVLVLSSAGLVAAESGPGEPFYRARLAVEAWFLPASGSEARLDADLDRAQARLNDATEAAARSDWNAEADAMGAYREVVESMSLTQDPAARETARQRLLQQLTGLEGLRAGAQAGAVAAVGGAIDSVNAVLARGAGEPTPGASGSGPTATPSQGPGSSSGNGPQMTPSGGSGPGSSASPGGSGGGGQGGGGQGGGGQGSGGP
jgi:hypothetical protein